MTQTTPPSGASTPSGPPSDLDLTHYEIRALADTLEKLNHAAAGAQVSGTLRAEVNATPGVTAVIRIRRNGTARVVSFR